MSDCSTSAMKAKERPGELGNPSTSRVPKSSSQVAKTCGNCGHSCGHGAKLYGSKYDYVPCLLEGTFEHESNHCSSWKSRTDEWGLTEQDKAIFKFAAEVDEKEQRRQQLEQVARDLYGLSYTLIEAIGDVAIRDDDAERRCFSALGTVQGASHVMERAKEQLEALGVSVDD